MILRYGKFDCVDEWYITFTSITPIEFDDINLWFSNTFKFKSTNMGWRKDKTSLTVFFHDESAYAFTLLKWA